MPGIPGYQADLDPYPFDLASAKDHMTKALAALGKTSAADLGKLKFGFNSSAGHEPRVAFLAEAWRQAFGLETDQIGSDFSVFLTQRTEGDYAISRDGWGADYPHANNQLNGLFTCHGGNNDSQYCNPDFDALIQQAAAEPDQDKQVALYNQAQTILMNDAAILPLRFATITYDGPAVCRWCHPDRFRRRGAGRPLLRRAVHQGPLIAFRRPVPVGPARRPAPRNRPFPNV